MTDAEDEIEPSDIDDSETSRLSRGQAILAIAAVLTVAGLVSRRYTPDPTHPATRRWYGSLEKPPYKPPDVLFGGIWPVLQVVHSISAYRLLRRPSSPERDTALGLWLLDIGLVAGWARLFFGGRSLTGGALGAVALVLSACTYVAKAGKLDKVAGLAAVPFAAWSAFGGVMSEDLRERNPSLDGHDPGLLERWRG